MVKRHPVKAGLAFTNDRGNGRKRNAAGCQEVKMTSFAHHVVVGYFRKGPPNRLSVTRVRQDDVVLGTPELHRYLDVFQCIRREREPERGGRHNGSPDAMILRKA